MSDEMKRSYQVDIEVLSQHSFVIDEVNSPEEAEEVARQWMDDGEEGAIIDKEVFSVDAYPVENEEDTN